MAVFQGEIVSPLGYGVNTLLRLQTEAVASIGYPVNTTSLIKGDVNNSTGLFTNTVSFLKGVNGLPLGNYQLYQSSFFRLFGQGSRQDSNFIYIQKSSLPLLTPGINKAESLFVALLLQLSLYESNDLVSKITISRFQTYFEVVNDLPVVNTVLLINLYILINDPLSPSELLPSATPNNF